VTRRLPRGQLYFDPATLLDLARHRGAVTAGPKVDELEAACVPALGAAHAVVLPHARVALMALLEALELPAGAEVLLTPVTIPDVVNVLLDAGLVPVWVDLGERTGNIDPADLRRKVGPKSRLLLLTHLCGVPSDLDAVLEVAEEHDLVVLEDASQALGTFGRAGFFSLTTLKPLSSFAGGLVLTDDGELAAALRARARGLPRFHRRKLAALLLRDLLLLLASDPRPYGLGGHVVLSLLESVDPRIAQEFQRGNVLLRRDAATAVRRRRLSEDLLEQYCDAQAAMALRVLPRLREWQERRRALVEVLDGRLRALEVPGLPVVPEHGEPSWWRYPLWTGAVHGLRRHLRRAGIDSAATNLCCASRESAFAAFAAETPHARAYCDGMIFLPLHPNLTGADMERVADAVGGWIRGGASPSRW
jgi:perosamine synthetase